MRAILMVNSECNMKCNHCYLPYSGSRNPKDALTAVNQLQDNGHSVVIAGSETLLDPEYLEAYAATGQKHLLTNGVLLDRDRSLYVLLSQHGIERLILSIHFGIQKDLNSVPESLVARVIRESKRRGFGIQITATITSGNYQKIYSMCEQAAEYGVEAIEFNRFVQIGKGNQISSSSLRPYQVNAVFDGIIKARRKFSESDLEIRVHGNFGPRPGSKGERLAQQNTYCPAGILMVAIDPQNRIYGCPFSMRPGCNIGRYEDGQILIDRDLLEGKRDTCITHILDGRE